MSRTARYLPENVCYHIIARGNHKQRIFLEEMDYRRYFLLIKKYKMKFKIAIYGFCLMPNHVHIIIRPLYAKDISRFMKFVNQMYTQYFNEKYDRCGHLWQDRFKSMIISDERYLCECVQYVEFNPVRAQLSEVPGDYKWSSYRSRALKINDGICDEFLESSESNKMGTVPVNNLSIGDCPPE